MQWYIELIQFGGNAGQAQYFLHFLQFLNSILRPLTEKRNSQFNVYANKNYADYLSTSDLVSMLYGSLDYVLETDYWPGSIHLKQ